MKKTLLLLAASVACAFPALAQKTYTLTSPDGRLRTTVAAGDALTYAVTLDGRPILDASPLSLTLDNGTTWGIAPRVTGVSRTSVDTAIPSPFYRSAEVRDRYNGLTLKMRGDWSVEFRTYDDGVAYRFVSRAEKPFNIVSEQAEYRFPADCAVTVPYVRDHAGNIDAQWRNSFENTYTETTLSKLDAGRLIFLPLVVDAGDGVKVCITETDLNDYPGMYLWNGDGGQHLTARFAPYPKRTEQGGYNNLQMVVKEREAECTEFIAAIPTVWDETRILGGRMGEYIVTARRSGDTWYVGAITDWTPRDVEVDLAPLGIGSTVEATIFRDGVNADRKASDYKRETIRIDTAEPLKIHLAPGGGFVAVLAPVR